jgi:hypothetical protein
VLRAGFILPLIVIVAIILGIIAWQGMRGEEAVATLAPPTNVVAAAVPGQPGALDVTWRWDDVRTGPDIAPAEFGVQVNGQLTPGTGTGPIFGRDDPNYVYTKRVTGLACDTIVTVVVDVIADSDTPVAAPPVQARTGPCPGASTPRPSPSPTRAPSPTPVLSTPPAAAEMPAPVITLTEPSEEAFIVHWTYDTEGAVVPTDFDVVVNGEVYERTAYMGTDFDYSRYVGEQPCGASVEVVIVAVNGELMSPSDPVEATTEPC